MKINHEYTKKILVAIESQDKARPFLGDVLDSLEISDVTQEFLLHYEILFDYGFIEGTGEDGSIGIVSALDEEILWSDVPIRLTAMGHEFIEALNKQEIWSVIKKEFKESSIKTIFKVSTDLAEGYAKKQVEKILEE